ncbi:hypothetical protein GHK92_00325 [Nocardioides sp. dk4132]|uniref:hypothetical protein n=1 Tax=unclassified Nocardioides TaxID=2615069 RepID=UPI0012967187|nr:MULTISPECIES: hypothetical protein [unclassified Nocardioides]MQW74309.1 hypothetical protein [Nocardioides sp. dk4132]QGA06261.1 hypothetical protein GFH29_01775 [Nocardioides sp. dk884]
MTASTSTRARLAAALAAGALMVGAPLAGMGTAQAEPVAKKKASVSKSIAFKCSLPAFGDFNHTGKVTVTATKKKKAAKANVTVKMAPMTIAGIPDGLGITTELQATATLKFGAKTAKASGKANIEVKSNLSVPTLKGKANVGKKAKKSVVKITKLDFSVPAFDMAGSCTPSGKNTIGTVKY